MAKLSSKRQITLPKALCERAHCQPGDSFRVVEHKGNITLIPQRRGAIMGLLKGIPKDPSVTESESRDSAIESER